MGSRYEANCGYRVCWEICMRRKIYDRLVEWKARENGSTALLVQGARRVGKSYIVEEFAKAEYDSYILIDFNKAGEEVRRLFDEDLDDLDTLFLKLSTYFNVRLHTRRSLIILDEVQLCPRARSAVKYLVADGRYDYIETGSLVSIRKNVEGILIPSEEDSVNLYPMDFEEFCWAMGNETLPLLIKSCFEKRVEMGAALHRKAMNLFRQYLIVGGMPQAVERYAQTRDFESVDTVKRRILKLYREDIRKHAGRDALKVEAIFDELPSQLRSHNRHFKFASVEKGAEFSEYRDALFWLSDAMVVNNCYNTTEPSVGLNLNRERTLLKCYMADTGLLVSHSFDENGLVSEEVYKKLLLGKLEVNMGMVMENAVAQMLAASGHRLFFYANASRTDAADRMEIDFLLAKSKATSRHNISPVEVKSSQRYALSSLRKFIAKYSEQLHTPYVLHPADLKVQDGIVYLPLYMASLL